MTSRFKIISPRKITKKINTVNNVYDFIEVKDTTFVDDMKYIENLWNDIKKKFMTLDLCICRDYITVDGINYLRSEHVYEAHNYKKVDPKEFVLFIIYMHFLGLVHFGFEPLNIKYGITNGDRIPKYHILSHNLTRLNTENFYELKHMLHIFAHDIKHNIHNHYDKYTDLCATIDRSFGDKTNMSQLAYQIVQIANNPASSTCFVPHLRIPFKNIYKNCNIVKTCIVHNLQSSSVLESIQNSIKPTNIIYPVCIDVSEHNNSYTINCLNKFAGYGLIHHNVELDFAKHFDIVYLVLDTFKNVNNYNDGDIVKLVHNCMRLSDHIVICSSIYSYTNFINVAVPYHPMNILYHDPIKSSNYTYYIDLISNLGKPDIF